MTVCRRIAVWDRLQPVGVLTGERAAVKTGMKTYKLKKSRELSVANNELLKSIVCLLLWELVRSVRELAVEFFYSLLSGQKSRKN